MPLAEHTQCHHHGGQHLPACQHCAVDVGIHQTTGEWLLSTGGPLSHPLTVEAAAGGVQQPAGLTGHRDEQVEVGAGQVHYH